MRTTETEYLSAGDLLYTKRVITDIVYPLNLKQLMKLTHNCIQ